MREPKWDSELRPLRLAIRLAHFGGSIILIQGAIL